jgi:DNA polymerase-1
MGVLEIARKAYAGLKIQQNGCPKGLRIHATPYEKNEFNEKNAAYQLIRNHSEVATVLQALDESDLIGLDLETTGLNPRTDRIRLLSLATDRGAFLLDCFSIDPRSLWEILAEKTLIAHNAAFDLGFLAVQGFSPGSVRDTLLLSQLVYAGRRESHKLVDCVQRELGKPLDKAYQTADWSRELTRAHLEYAAADVAVLAPLHQTLDAKIKKAGLAEVDRIEHRCLPAMVWLAQSGIGFHVETWQTLAREAAEEVHGLGKELDRLAPAARQPGIFGSGWSWDSPQQVKEVFQALGISVESTDDDHLAKVDHPLASVLRKYREARKKCTTYGKDWLKHVAGDGRVYPSWRQIGAESGRMSCSAPNLQQVPRGAHRRCFQAPPGRVLIKADYSQIELRIAAKISGDQNMLRAYRTGLDLHTVTAQRILGRENVSRDDRQLAKSANFGLLYGMGPEGYQTYARSEYGVELTLEQAQSYREAFFAAYPGLRSWHRSVRNQHASETRTLAGRRRLLPAEAFDTWRLNTPVQGTGADGLKLALALLWERREQVLSARPVLVAHDEIVVECPIEQSESVAAWLKQAMIDAMASWLEPVPVEVEVRTAPTWGG